MPSEESPQKGQAAIAALVDRGRALGLDVETEVPIRGGVDVVWFFRGELSRALGRLPAVAFEIESS